MLQLLEVSALSRGCTGSFDKYLATIGSIEAHLGGRKTNSGLDADVLQRALQCQHEDTDNGKLQQGMLLTEVLTVTKITIIFPKTHDRRKLNHESQGQGQQTTEEGGFEI